MPAMSLYPLVTTKYFGGTIVHAGWVEVLFAAAMLIGSFAVGIFGKTKDRMPHYCGLSYRWLEHRWFRLSSLNMNGFWVFLVLNVLLELWDRFIPQ